MLKIFEGVVLSETFFKDYPKQVGNTRALHVFNSFFLFASVCLFPIFLFSSLLVLIKPSFCQPCNWQLDNGAQKVVCGCGCGCECLIILDFAFYKFRYQLNLFSVWQGYAPLAI